MAIFAATFWALEIFDLATLDGVQRKTVSSHVVIISDWCNHNETDVFNQSDPQSQTVSGFQVGELRFLTIRNHILYLTVE